MSSPLGPGKTLEVLETLKGTVRDLRERAEKLNTDFRGHLARERLRRQAAADDQAAHLAAANAECESAFEAAKVAAEAAYQARKTRISKAFQASKDQALERIENRTGARKYELQKRMLQAERNRETGLTNTTTAAQEFRTQLATEEEALVALEREAQARFKGYRKLLRLFHEAYDQAHPDLSPSQGQLLAELRRLLESARNDLDRFGKRFFLSVFRSRILWTVLALVWIPLVPLLQQSGYPAAYPEAGAAVLGTLALVFVFRYAAQHRAEPPAKSISKTLANARALHDGCHAKSETHYEQELQRIRDEYTHTTETVERELKQALAQAGEMRVGCRMKSDERAVRAGKKNDQLYRAKLARLEREQVEALERLKTTGDARAKAAVAASEEREAQLNAEHQVAWQKLEAESKTKLQPLFEAVAAANRFAEEFFPPWNAPLWRKWTPPVQFSGAAKFGSVEVDVEQLSGGLPSDKRLALPGPSHFAAALSLAFPGQGSILLETAETGHEAAIGALNTIILRLLAMAPPGRLNFTILDPVGLGQNFAGVMHLADYEEQIINSRIWTQSGQIEQRLADLNEHMEKVIQMYLRNEYSTIAEYNEQAGVIAEKYHFLVVADFPANFTETAAKRLLSIAASGARCGVYMLIHWDHRHPLPAEFIPDDLRKSCFCISAKGQEFMFAGKATPGATLHLDEPPASELATEFVHQVGRGSRDSSRVEVPFEHVTPKENELWTEDTTTELRVPIGRTGATKLQYLAIGKGTCQHGLIAGKTGSGKSTLFHVVVTNLSLWCSPEQVEFYLVDFKKGVEFKCYASHRLPHARVIAIESDREFGLSVLQRVDEELKRRGDLFRKLGVQDIAGYKRAGGTEKIPRSLLMIDEFQEFFVEDDKIAQTASLLLDRLVRQGRAFGIHVLLGSQTLGGAYTVARTTLGQMVIRIALQCNEADAYLIMDDNNPAPRLLSRPGEGIYNDKAGILEGNSPFQVVWLPDQVRDKYLGLIRARADRSGTEYPDPVVFEGNAPADVRENVELRQLLEAETVKKPLAPRIWLGAPNSIKGPTEAAFPRQSGSNLVIVGQRDETTLALLALGLVSLSAQFPRGSARFILCDSNLPGSPARTYLERVIGIIPHPVTLAKQGDLAQILSAVAGDVKNRSTEAEDQEAPAIFLFIHELQKYSKLRYEDDLSFSVPDPEAPPNPALLLNHLIGEGTRLGFHVIATCDTYNNVNRFLGRKALSEFAMRVLFQMSANDSASLIDNPKASLLGLHRALFYSEHEGYLETFRPYALPGNEWLQQAAWNLTRLLR